MVTKKIKKSRQDTNKAVVSAPDLEQKRKQFQQAAEKRKLMLLSAEPKIHSARKRTVIIIVGAFLLMAGSAAVTYAYFFWYNSPDKIVVDALTNAASSRSVMYDARVTSKGEDIVRIDGEYTDGRSSLHGTITTGMERSLAKVDASVIATERDVFLKVSNATELTRTAIPKSQEQVFNLIAPLLRPQIDGQWVQMNTNDAALFQSATKVSACSASAIKQVSTHQGTREAVMRLYLAHPFFDVKKTQSYGDESVFGVSIDQAEFDEFSEELQTSGVKNLIAGCDDELKWLKANLAKAATLDLTINTSSRVITHAKILATDRQPIVIDIAPKFDQPVTINEPQESIQLNAVKAVLFDAFEKLQPN